MAYLSQEKAKLIKAEIKKQFPKKQGWKFSIRVRHHSTLCVNILSAPVEFVEGKTWCSLNNYSSYNHDDIFKKLVGICNGNFLGEDESNFNDSDPMTDYFSVGWYVNIEQGSFDKPFVNVNSVTEKMKLL